MADVKKKFGYFNNYPVKKKKKKKKMHYLFWKCLGKKKIGA